MLVQNIIRMKFLLPLQEIKTILEKKKLFVVVTKLEIVLKIKKIVGF